MEIQVLLIVSLKVTKWSHSTGLLCNRGRRGGGVWVPNFQKKSYEDYGSTLLERRGGGCMSNFHKKSANEYKM